MIAAATPAVLAPRRAITSAGPGAGRATARPDPATPARANVAGPVAWVRRVLPRPWLALARTRLDLFRVLGLGDLVRSLAGPRRAVPLTPAEVTTPTSDGELPLLSSL
jgi:hypothetical protein